MKKLLTILLAFLLSLQLATVSIYAEGLPIEEFPELSEDTEAETAPPEITTDAGEITTEVIVTDGEDTTLEDDVIDVDNTTELPAESTVPADTTPQSETAATAATTAGAGVEVPFSATLYVTGGTVNVRSDTSTLGVILGKLSVGEEINTLAKVFANGMDWYKFSYKGNNAYAVASVFTDKKETTTSAPVVTSAPPATDAVIEPPATETAITEITTQMETLPSFTTTAGTDATTAETTTKAAPIGAVTDDSKNPNDTNSSGMIIAAVVAFLVLALGISVPLLIKYFRHKKIYEY